MQAIRRATFLAAALLLAAGGTARAASFEVKVPFPFMVNGQQMPAGEYRLVRDQTSIMLIRAEKQHTPAIFVSTIPVDGQDPAGDKPALTFVMHANQYQLANIWEPGLEGGQGYATAQAPPAHSMHSAGTHATRGVVKSIDDTMLVIRRSGNHPDMTFTLNQSTERSGTISAGTPVSVRYRDDAKIHVATAVRVDPAKPQAAAHAATKD